MSLSVALAIHNEEKTLKRTLDSVYDIADEIIIVDGESTDGTMQVIKDLDHASKVKVFSEPNPPMFHINKQKALEHCAGEWILQLDADEVVSEELKKEIMEIVRGEAEAQTQAQPVAFWIPRLNFFLGKPLRKGGQYPDPTIRLYKNGVAHFPCKSVHEQVDIKGQIGHLKHDLLHYSYPSFESFIEKWIRYSVLEAQLLKDKGVRPSAWNFLLYMSIYPKFWFLKTYFRHKGFVDGFPGFIFSLLSALRYWAIYIKLYEITKSA